MTRILLTRFALGFLLGFMWFVFSNPSEQWQEPTSLAELYALQILAGMEPE